MLWSTLYASYGSTKDASHSRDWNRDSLRLERKKNSSSEVQPMHVGCWRAESNAVLPSSVFVVNSAQSMPSEIDANANAIRPGHDLEEILWLLKSILPAV
jgi:hypothetical protein